MNITLYNTKCFVKQAQRQVDVLAARLLLAIVQHNNKHEDPPVPANLNYAKFVAQNMIVMNEFVHTNVAFAKFTSAFYNCSQKYGTIEFECKSMNDTPYDITITITPDED